MRFQRLSDHFHAENPEQFANLHSLLWPHHQYTEISNSLQTLHHFLSRPVYVFERIRDIFGQKSSLIKNSNISTNFCFPSEMRSPLNKFLNYVISTTNVRNVLKTHLCQALKLLKTESCILFSFSVISEFIFRLLREALLKINYKGSPMQNLKGTIEQVQTKLYTCIHTVDLHAHLSCSIMLK